ncbi:MAG: dephospho-CoA kinase [Raineya sp.]
MKTNRKPLEVGITGGIGSGKSTVSHIFSILGIPIYDADSRAKYLMAHKDDLKRAIQQAFGAEAYMENGELNRGYLASQVFSDAEKVKIINSLVHPEVAKDYLHWLAQQQSPYIVREAALMIESGSYKLLDVLITVFAPENLRIERIKKRDPQRSETEIRAIISKQTPEEEKLRLADFVIYNDEKQALIPQVLALHRRFGSDE